MDRYSLHCFLETSRANYLSRFLKASIRKADRELRWDESKNKALLALIRKTLVSPPPVSREPARPRKAGRRRRDGRRLTFLEKVLRSWEKRVPLNPAQLGALGEEAYARGWGLAGIWEQQFLEKIQGSLTKAIASGTTYSEWTQNEGQRILDAFGAGVQTYRGGKRWDPWYSELVMRNATQASFAGGRYSAMWAPEWQEVAPFWRYYATIDDRTRPAHAALHGRVFRKGDPAARPFLPPWGHACRCQAQELTLAEVEDAGYQITPGHQIPLLPTEGGGTIGRPPGGWDVDRVAATKSRVLTGAAPPSPAP